MSDSNKSEVSKQREHVPEIGALIEDMQPRIQKARQLNQDPEGRMPRLHEGLASANEMHLELRIKYKNGRYLWLMTSKTIGDALGGHAGSLELPSERRGGIRYYHVDRSLQRAPEPVSHPEPEAVLEATVTPSVEAA